MQEIQNKINLKNYNTFHINACADKFIEITNEEYLPEIIDKYHIKNPFILGGGSNILLKDDIPGFTLYIDNKGITVNKINDEEFIIDVSAGEYWHDFVKFCVLKGCHGLENLALIPGKAGAAPIQNIGAYNAEQKDCFHSLKGFLIDEMDFVELNYDDCRFNYRDSIFKKTLKKNFIITSVRYKLSRSFNPNIEYKELKSAFLNIDIKDILPISVFEKICEIRKSKLPDHEKIGNAGSFFKNPIISEFDFNVLKAEYPDITGYKSDKYIKINAAWLIEKCGFKGQKLNSKSDAAVSENHALILINNGNATGKEIYELSELIIKKVQNKFGVLLYREVNVIG
jgi:UDP-N-acetylmuramate dehydrogenase